MTSHDGTPTLGPVTPAPEHATLPTMAALASAATATADNTKHPQIFGLDKARETPPLSSQLAPSRSMTPISRPSTAHLSSPPPTVTALPSVARQVEKESLSFSPNYISQASPERLRSIIADLLPALQEARTDAAHHKLQHQMLAIESAEVVERIQVEMDMAQAEREVLQSGDQQQGPAEVQHQLSPAKAEVDPNVRSVHVDLYNAMVNEIQDLKTRNMHHESTIAQQKRMIVQQESEIASMTDRIGLLRERLQENREHLNRYRRPSAAPEGTPRSERSTPYRTQHRDMSATYSREHRPFDALLHATDLMSHTSPSAPQTPKRKRDYRPSAPLTPQTVQPRTSRNVYETPQSNRHTHLKVPMSAPAPRMGSLTGRIPSATQPQRGHESDGTVSATDDSEAETDVPGREDMPESRASREAAELLRTPTRSPPQQYMQQQQPRSVSGGQPLTQSRLFGQVKKSSLPQHQQREDAEPHAKRPRGNSIGLGIAGYRET